MKRKKLLDVNTNLDSDGKESLFSPMLHAFTLKPTSPFHNILKEYENITKPANFNQEIKHNVVHHITTKGPPVFTRSRRLSAEKLKIAKLEFEHMLELGIIRPSSSQWSSALHMVPKKLVIGVLAEIIDVSTG